MLAILKTSLAARVALAAAASAAVGTAATTSDALDLDGLLRGVGLSGSGQAQVERTDLGADLGVGADAAAADGSVTGAADLDLVVD